MIVKLLVISVCLSILFNCGVNGAYISFYRDWEFKHLVVNTSILSGCHQFPYPNTTIEGVLTDSCVVLYEGKLGENCIEENKDLMYKAFPGKRLVPWVNITGYRMCTYNGEEQLNIDVIIPTMAGWFDSLSVLTIVKTHRDICACVNIDESTHTFSYWGLENYGNEYVAYFERDCMEMNSSAQLILGRQTWYSEKAFRPTDKNDILITAHIVKSIGPSINSTHFMRNCILKPISDLQNITDKFEQHFSNLAVTSNKTQASINRIEEMLKGVIAVQQKQKIETRKLEEKYDEDEIFIEIY